MIVNLGDCARGRADRRGVSNELADRIMNTIRDWQETTTATDDEGVKEFVAPVMAMSGLCGFFLWLSGQRIDEGFQNGMHVAAIDGMQRVIDTCNEEEQDE